MLKKSIIPFVTLILILGGCTGKLVTVKFVQKSNGNSANALTFQADGTHISTETSQKATGKLPVDFINFLSSLSEVKGVVSNLQQLVPAAVTAPPVVVPIKPTVAPTIPTVPVTPTNSGEKITVSSSTVGCGNPVSSGCRELYKFSNPGSFYGKNIEVSFDKSYTFIVPNGAVRTELPDGRLWKPLSDVDGKLAIHGPGGAHLKTCTIKYSPK